MVIKIARVLGVAVLSAALVLLALKTMRVGVTGAEFLFLAALVCAALVACFRKRVLADPW